MTEELVTAAVGLIGGGTGLALARGVEYAIKRGSDAWRSRAEKRAQTEADDAKSRRERDETDNASVFIATEAITATLRAQSARLDHAEARLDHCELEKSSCLEALAAAEERCRRETAEKLNELEQRLSVRMRAAVVDEVARKSTPTHGTPAAVGGGDET